MTDQKAPSSPEDDEYDRLIREASSEQTKALTSSRKKSPIQNFEMDQDGLWLLTKFDTESDSRRERISDPFEVVGSTRNPSNQGWGVLLRWSDPDGHRHEFVVPNSAVFSQPAIICGQLADQGLCIEVGQQANFVKHLGGCRPEARITRADHTGWLSLNDRRVFVLPDRTLGEAENELVMLEHGLNGRYASAGSLEDWQNGVGKLSKGNSLVVFSISAALAGPLLELIGLDGGGIHFYGPSSSGKTTLLQAAASVWGCGNAKGFVGTWRATANGLEGAAAAASDTALIMDEFALIAASEVGAALYSLGNGVGKARMNRDATLRQSKTWRTQIISSGEITVDAKIGEDKGRRVQAGQAVRLIDVSADCGFGLGAFNNTGELSTASALANALKSAATSAYGTAGPIFVESLIKEDVTEMDVRQAVEEMKAALALPDHADGQVIRVAERIALIAVAGEFATQFSITPWAKGAAASVARFVFDRWITLRGGTQAGEVKQVISQVRLFIEQHGDGRFELLQKGSDYNSAEDRDLRPIHNRAGWRDGSGPNQEWLIPPEVWKTEVCKGLDSTFAARVLAKHAMLLAPEGTRLSQNRRILGRQVRVYVLTSAILEGG